MSDFQKMEQEAEQAAQGHSSEVDQGVQDAEQGIDQRVGEGHADDVQKAGDALEKELGVQQDQQGGNPPS